MAHPCKKPKDGPPWVRSDSCKNKLFWRKGGPPAYDCVHSYTWNAEGRPKTIDSVTLVYDALDRMVEQQRGTGNTQIVYGPGTMKLGLFNGQTLVKGFAPLPAAGTAVYTPGMLPAYYRHGDWLGSSRLATTPSRGLYYDGAYAP
jgi:hypothetical protein